MKLRKTTHCPNCGRLAQQDAEIAALKAQLVQAIARIAQLEQQLATARKDSSTSSKPPSSDIVKPKQPLAKGGKKRRKGGQPGHEQHLRSPFPPEAVPYTLDCCPDCGGTLVLSRRESEVLQQVEIATCAQHGRAVFQFLLDWVQAHFGGTPRPSLLPSGP